MRTSVIAGNWKMFKTQQEATELVNGLLEGIESRDGREMVVIPPYTDLSVVQQLAKNSAIKVGAQNVHWEEEGAFTGEISVLMLREIGLKYVVIGHSERRKYFCETDEIVNKKIRKVLEHGLSPIVCIGETLEEREAQRQQDVVKSQIEGGLVDLSQADTEKIVIAYEPVWAIGTGKTATSDQASTMHRFIRDTMAALYTPELAESIRILYGGSVKPTNIDELMAEKDIDGALVGGASLKVDSFLRIFHYQ